MNKFFIWSRWSDGRLMPSAFGLKLIADSLIRRYKFQKDSIIVCSTLAEFREHLNLISKTENNFRNAFIIPTHSSIGGEKQDGTFAKRLEDLPQHILTVGIKKEGSEIHIAILEPLCDEQNTIIKADHIGLDLEEDSSFTLKELVISYILSSHLSPKMTNLSHSIFPREFDNGCWAFALKDAVKFLKDPNFFTIIKLGMSKDTVEIKGFTIKANWIVPTNFITMNQYSNVSFENHFKLFPHRDTPDMRRKIAKHMVKGINLRILHAAVEWTEQLRQTSLSLNT